MSAARLRVLPALLLTLAVLPALVPAPASAQAPGQSATAGLDPAPNPWALGDALAQRLEPLWNASRGLYIERGLPDTRLNALMLQLHGMAALAGHTGPIRNDARIPAIADVLTKPPVLVQVNLKPRTTGHFPHAPAWTGQIGENPEQATLHPSLDTGAVRGLLSAWRARNVAGMPAELQQRIANVFLQTARSPFYRAPSRALNQINWHTEVYAAAFETTGDTGVLADYRAQLAWFADHADKPAYKGGSPNLTSGGGFRYLPNRKKNAQLNRIESVEYGNLAWSSLGWYHAAVRAGMPALSSRQLAVLKGWAKHMLLGAWTHSGYPNWDTGLGDNRRHLRQYWAWSLDGLVAASGPDALLGYPDQRRYARTIVSRGISLYLNTAWTPDMASPDRPLPLKTSFGAPNGFSSGSGNQLIGPLRFAVMDASLDGRFQDVARAMPPNWYAHDKETGRLSFSTSAYNGAIVPTRAGQAQGGLEPVRLFDGDQRPLTALGGRGTGSLGAAIVKGGTARADTQPAAPGRQTTTDTQLDGRRADSASAFSSLKARGTVKTATGRITVAHRFATRTIDTTLRFSKLKEKSRVSVRLPVWGEQATISLTRGAKRRGGGWQRTGGALRMVGTTPDGARITYDLKGVPAKADLGVVTIRPDAYRPSGVAELVVVFDAAKSGSHRLQRRITVSAT